VVGDELDVTGHAGAADLVEEETCGGDERARRLQGPGNQARTTSNTASGGTADRTFRRAVTCAAGWAFSRAANRGLPWATEWPVRRAVV